jgi:hypothetical protein
MGRFWNLLAWKPTESPRGSLIQKDARALQVVDDRRPAFSEKFDEEADQSMLMRQTLAVGNYETRDVTLTGVDKEFVSPDIRK